MTVQTDRRVSEKAAIRDHADDRISSVRRAAPFPLQIGGIFQ